MKKIVCILAVLAFCLTTSPVMANYKIDLRMAVMKILEQFHQEEQGNRLTSFSMKGLSQDLNRAFMENVAMPEKKTIPEKPQE